jgi:hypothetical protein
MFLAADVSGAISWAASLWVSCSDLDRKRAYFLGGEEVLITP